MKIGLHISDFTFPNGSSGLAKDLTRVVAAAEDAGFARVSVMDHVWQISVHGPPEHEMLEAYTTLGYLAARTSRVDLLAWVTAVSYREPGLLAKIISTDVSVRRGRGSGSGRAGTRRRHVDSGWAFRGSPNASSGEGSCRSAGRCGPDDDGPFRGKHYHLDRTLMARAAASAADSHRGGWGHARCCGWSRSTPTRATCSSGRSCRATGEPRALRGRRQTLRGDREDRADGAGRR